MNRKTFNAKKKLIKETANSRKKETKTNLIIERKNICFWSKKLTEKPLFIFSKKLFPIFFWILFLLTFDCKKKNFVCKKKKLGKRFEKILITKKKNPCRKKATPCKNTESSAKKCRKTENLVAKKILLSKNKNLQQKRKNMKNSSEKQHL